MGVAALVLGIISIIIGFIPFCGAIALLPAIVGLVLGIIDTVKKSKKGEPKGMSIAGLVLSAVAIAIIIFWVFVISVGIGMTASTINEMDSNQLNEFVTKLDQIEGINARITVNE